MPELHPAAALLKSPVHLAVGLTRHTSTPYQPGAHHLVLNHLIVKALKEGNQRIMVFMPPRHGKTELLVKWGSLWTILVKPDWKVMSVTASGDFALENGRWVRDMVQEYGQYLRGIGLDPSARNMGNWKIRGRKGGMLSVGAGGQVTGRGGNMLLADDLVKNSQEALSYTRMNGLANWWDSTFYNRRDDKNASVILLNTRWSNNDISARILESQGRIEEGGEWQVVNMPAIAETDEYVPGEWVGRDSAEHLLRRQGEALWPSRWPIDELERTKRTTSRFWFSAMYQGNPVALEEAAFAHEYFELDDFWYDEHPETDDIAFVVIAVDPSVGQDNKAGDYSAVVTATANRKDGRVYIEADIARRPVGELKHAILRAYRKHRPNLISIESNGFQTLLMGEINDLAAQWGEQIKLRGVAHTIHKGMRILDIEPWLGHGILRFRRTPGTQLLVSQLKEFPAGSHDDGPDALQMALSDVQAMRRGVRLADGKAGLGGFSWQGKAG